MVAPVITDGMVKGKTLVLGNGFLGSTFKRNGFHTVGRQFMSIEEMMANPDELDSTFEFHEADIIINCIGESNTRFCEDPLNWRQVLQVNGLFPGYLSDICGKYGKKFVHISTGCLYENTQGTKKEYDLLETHCNYTVSKHVGELNCDISHDLIIRPRLLFDKVHSPKNLLSKFSKFDRFLNEFNTVTSTQTIVDSTIALLKNCRSGVYNVGNTGTYTIYEMAKAFGCHPLGYMQQAELIESQGLYLVNNVMDMTKLYRHTGFVPNDTLIEIQEYALCLK
jgi:UDP-glucose 4,6-dehydratase